MKKFCFYLVVFMFMGPAYGQYKGPEVSVTCDGDSVFFSEARASSSTVESARTQALNMAIDAVVVFNDTAFVQRAPQASEAKLLENYTLQIETMVEKKGSLFEARVLCTAKRKTKQLIHIRGK